ncbi:BTAD domain-containing putative transcriptional regulator [Microbispora sp. NPDC049125]|uniref:AfsR/SARP family transcriptional regulator n=1 Tax=Microbispora sp. NPDC049125 TaxID=3154929 RepID=UPI00346516F5
MDATRPSEQLSTESAVTADDSAGFRPALLRLRLLGPVAAWREGQGVPLGPPLQRATLCLLASQPGQVVTKAKLIGGLWDGPPPKTAAQSIYTYIAGLRRVLEPGKGPRGPFSALLNRSMGYVLLRESLRIDAEDFQRGLQDARRLRAADDYEGSLKAFDAAWELWSGPALCGVPGPFADAERIRLEELRLAAGEDRADVLLHLGRHQEAAEGLTDLVSNAPVRERARELLMIALYRCGRQAEALNSYVEIRTLLADQLGVDPGERLRTCHELILRNDPRIDPPGSGEIHLSGPSTASSPEKDPHTPRQLPRDIGLFVGRTEELRRLRSLLAPGNGDPSQAVVAITGTAGAGKSALAIHAAHAVRDAFPDGQVYANLLGATPGVEQLGPLDVLGRLLRALGTRPEAVPSEPDEAATMLRDRLQKRRVLIVLDDASGPDQVRPLLRMPLGTAVLITSRESFSIADDCVPLRLATMPPDEALAMLSALLGASRVAIDSSDAAELVRVCGGLPLALRLAAARLTDRPHAPLGDLVRRLRDRRRILHELEAGEITIRASLELSYDLLSRSPRPIDQAAARALCHLGVLHIPSIAPDILAALLDASSAEAERCVDRLVRAHLAETDEHGRVLLHDLVRLFAMEMAERHLNDGTRRDALERALGLYGVTARLAMKLMDPQRVHPAYTFAEREPVPLAGLQDAHAWLGRESANILAAAAQAMSSPDHSVARTGAHLAFSCHWPLAYTGHRNDVRVMHQQALRVGERTGDQNVLALAHGYLGTSLHFMGREEEALAHLRTELALQRSQRDRFAEMKALGNMSVTYSLMERYEEALSCSQAQQEIAREIGSEVGARHSLLGIGWAQFGLGDLPASMAAACDLHTLAREAGDRMHEAEALCSMARVRFEEDAPGPACDLFEQALLLSREVGYRDAVPRILTHLGRSRRLLGHIEVALACFREALTVGRELGDESWEAAAAKELALLDGSDHLDSAGPKGEEQVDAIGHR